LSNLIFALGIRYVGNYASKLLAQKIDNLFDLQDKNSEDLANIPEIGHKIAESIVLFFKKEENLEIIQKLKDADVNLSSQEKIAGKRTLREIQFVLTGTLEHFTREEAKNAIERLGGRVTGNVTKKTDYLVLGKEPGQKYKKAKEMNVNIIEEKEFKEMLEK